MSETFVNFVALGLIVTVHFIIVVNRLDRLEEKINELKGKVRDKE